MPIQENRYVKLRAAVDDQAEAYKTLPIGSELVPFCGLYLESYKVIPKRNY